MAKIYLLDIENLFVEDYFPVKSKLRAEYISSIKDEKRKKQSFFVWKLLECALDDLGVKNNEFYVLSNRWGLVGDSVYFSLSHSNNLVVVAISENKIGVDIEKLDKKLFGLEKRYKTPKNSENMLFYLAKCFTAEEANFKALDKMESKSFLVKDNKTNEYCLSVCTDEKIEIINIDKL